MKNIFIIPLILLLASCSNVYVEPPISTNDTILNIEVEHPFKFNAPFGMIIEVEIDGKLIHAYNYPNLTARVSPGRHIIEVSVSAYFYNRAKHAFSKKYEIDFKPNEKYTISSDVESFELKNNTDNTTAILHIKSSELNISDTYTLKDNKMRSMACEMPDCILMILGIPKVQGN